MTYFAGITGLLGFIVSLMLLVKRMKNSEILNGTTEEKPGIRSEVKTILLAVALGISLALLLGSIVVHVVLMNQQKEGDQASLENEQVNKQSSVDDFYFSLTQRTMDIWHETVNLRGILVNPNYNNMDQWLTEVTAQANWISELMILAEEMEFHEAFTPIEEKYFDALQLIEAGTQQFIYGFNQDDVEVEVLNDAMDNIWDGFYNLSKLNVEIEDIYEHHKLSLEGNIDGQVRNDLKTNQLTLQHFIPEQGIEVAYIDADGNRVVSSWEKSGLGEYTNRLNYWDGAVRNNHYLIDNEGVLEKYRREESASGEVNSEATPKGKKVFQHSGEEDKWLSVSEYYNDTHGHSGLDYMIFTYLGEKILEVDGEEIEVAHISLEHSRINFIEMEAPIGNPNYVKSVERYYAKNVGLIQEDSKTYILDGEGGFSTHSSSLKAVSINRAAN
ncbi:hypothetical protein [Anoxynatronum sibiricum]|uniref:Uncharacterized protein n=1 Tax=Anoxynatronum sibiricum TaxID=210623 RepID=A0ABU9VX96_9CLOT